ncbi:hypothetical protein Tco_1401861 [Tanacetum coccineum]
MQKNLALIAKYIDNIYKPTNNNLRTSSNTRNKNVDTSTRHKNDNQSGQFRNQRTVTVAGARETIWNQEKMMLCKHEEKGVLLSAEQGEWLNDSDEEPDKQEMEAHYMYMEKIQEVLTAKSGPTFDAEPLKHVQFNDDYNVFAIKRQHSKQPETINDTYVVEMVDSNVTLDSSDMCDNEGKADQNAKEYEDECVVLANLIANLKLDHDKNKKSLKQLKKANTSLAHELKECKYALEESNVKYYVLGEMRVDECCNNRNEGVSELNKLIEKMKENSVDTKFAKPSILGKPILHPIRNQSVVRQPTAFKSELPKSSKPRFASQVDVNNDLSKPVTTYYLPKERESVFAKPHHMIALGSSRYSSNEIVHNHYPEEA